MACLDTTVLLDLAGRGGRRKRADAEAKLRQLEHDQPHSITRFTKAELLIGFERASDPARERPEFDRILAKLRILEFDARAMRFYAKIFVHLRAWNRLSGIMDMLIASVALAEGQHLLTRNRTHYEHIPGLRVESY